MEAKRAVRRVVKTLREKKMEPGMKAIKKVKKPPHIIRWPQRAAGLTFG